MIRPMIVEAPDEQYKKLIAVKTEENLSADDFQ